MPDYQCRHLPACPDVQCPLLQARSLRTNAVDLLGGIESVKKIVTLVRAGLPIELSHELVPGPPIRCISMLCSPVHIAPLACYRL